MLSCPKCYNDHLLIRRRNGFERVMIFVTGKRKYVCMTCAHVFRAPDRRRNPRPEESAVLGTAHREAVRS